MHALQEECAVYKGRCTNLTRDVELHYNQLHKVSSENSGSSEQIKILADRASQVQDDLENMRSQRNEAQDNARLEAKKVELLEKELV